MENRRNLTGELVSRQSQYSFYKYLGMMPNPDTVLRRTGKTIEAYRELRSDPHVWSCIQSRKSGLLALESVVNPNNAPKPLVDEITKILDELDMNRLHSDILDAPLFGCQPLEIIWKFTGGQRRFLIPDEVIAKPQEWFMYDGDGKFRYRAADNPAGIIPPPMKIINVRFEASYQNPYGSALLGKCYWPVTFKNGGLRFWVNFMEKYGMPILLGQYTRGASTDEAQKLADELARLTEDSVIVAPSDIKLELHEAVRSTSVELYRELIKHCNTEISKAILSQTLTTELDGGSYSAAQIHYKVRRDVVLSDIRLVESTVNTLIKFIVDLNYDTPSYPKYNLIIDDSENMQRIDRDLKIAKAGD
ncbi:MAG: hypothetical protein QG635_1418, partial [Bacteroidota bacterium]|nr:hypothetical protein [Bacteroidota bacterium]